MTLPGGWFLPISLAGLSLPTGSFKDAAIFIRLDAVTSEDLEFIGDHFIHRDGRVVLIAQHQAHLNSASPACVKLAMELKQVSGLPNASTETCAPPPVTSRTASTIFFTFF